NQCVIADSLSLCSAYQLEEFKAYSATMFVGKTQLWGPEMILKVEKDYKMHRSAEGKQDRIGFYSSAYWLRKELGDLDLGNNSLANEQALLAEMVRFCREHGKELVIFLHPLEKKEAHRARTKAYYAEQIPDAAYQFAPLDQPSNALFETVEIGVTLYSTIMFERLYFGFKALFYPVGWDGFPVEGAALRNICAYSPTELGEQLAENMKGDEAAFFERNGLEAYVA
ncbi:MAG: hypothetical protein AAF570_24040, partial [Bacteroidota bacterium]